MYKNESTGWDHIIQVYIKCKYLKGYWNEVVKNDFYDRS